jgi:hypothetical protein
LISIPLGRTPAQIFDLTIRYSCLEKGVTDLLARYRPEVSKFSPRQSTRVHPHGLSALRSGTVSYQLGWRENRQIILKDDLDAFLESLPSVGINRADWLQEGPHQAKSKDATA